MHRFSWESTYFIAVTWQKYFLNCNLSDFFSHFSFSRSNRKLLLTIRFGGDLLVAVFRNYFPFSWSSRTMPARRTLVSKRIPNWKTIRRMDEIFLLFSCIVFHTLPPQWVLCVDCGMMISPVCLDFWHCNEKIFRNLQISSQLEHWTTWTLRRHSTSASTINTNTHFSTLKLMESNYFAVMWNNKIRLSSAALWELRTWANIIKMERKGWRKKTFQINAEIMWHYLKLKSIFAIVAFCLQFNLLYSHIFGWKYVQVHLHTHTIVWMNRPHCI